MHVLISAFACSPGWGSEVGMGWNWVTNLAVSCDLTVITESGFRDEIETGIASSAVRQRTAISALVTKELIRVPRQ